jgi:hypothetical protein
MFAGLKLNARPAPSQERGDRGRSSGRKGKGACGRRRRPTGWPSGRGGSRRLRQAVDRYARAYQSIDQHRREGLPVLDMQRQEMRDAGQQLDQVRTA